MRRRFIQYVGLGSLSFALATQDARQVIASPLTDISSGETDDLILKTFVFYVESVNSKGITKSHKAYTEKYCSVPLTRANVLSEPIDMVAIAPGRFLVGTSSSDIPPTHHAAKGNELLSQRMSVSSFFMSKSAITQAQWSAVAALPKKPRAKSSPISFSGRQPSDGKCVVVSRCRVLRSPQPIHRISP